jgi:DNA-directed RNA polymerase specialized sigma24 family protein
MQKIYPHDLFPRQWFPDLDAIISDLFREAWEQNADFRKGLAAADVSRTSEMVTAELGLTSLLARHPRALVLIYRQMISGFIRRLHRRHDESQDIIQEIFARLLSGKLAKIQEKFDDHFNPMPSFTSYFMVCIRNMYVDIVREGRNLAMKRDDVPLQVLENEQGKYSPTCQGAFLAEEFAKLRAILQLHPSSRNKIVLCLKLKCRCAVSGSDARLCFPACSADDIGRLGADFRNVKDRDLYQAIVPVFNRHEAKAVLADTLRKWIENKTNLLIDHMNRLHGETVYDSENIIDLLTLFFSEEKTNGRP